MEDYLLKIVIVGHIDHGKSTLIGRLLLDTHSLADDKMKEIKRISKELGRDTELAYLIDHLKEEREHEMTIDTSQIFFHTRKRHYVIIDAPGHVEFLKNMLTGATQAEAAVLIVDTQAGIKEQTRRHAFLIGLLGIKNIIVLCNKMDLINFNQARFEEVKNELSQFFKNLGIEPLFFIPASAKEGLNIVKRSPQMNWYKGPCLIEALDSLMPKVRIEELPLRFPIQDVYEIKGEKIIAGKLASGAMERGQTIKLMPAAKETRVNSIRVFGKNIRRAQAGENIGLELEGTLFAKRGEVIVDNARPASPVLRFKGDVFWMAEAPLEINKPITLRCATQEVACVPQIIEKRINSSTLEILEENAKELKINEAGVVFFKTERPVILEKFSYIEELGRFVLESAHQTQGAGIVTENNLT